MAAVTPYLWLEITLTGSGNKLMVPLREVQGLERVADGTCVVLTPDYMHKCNETYDTIKDRINGLERRYYHILGLTGSL